ncbi:MAG: hypothetical protein KGD64_11235 [Candidatus Heimdallarchaeota archaeon]|nr:hypothetical protein [Candidatus Heimdallarchaeota archaeon]
MKYSRLISITFIISLVIATFFSLSSTAVNTVIMGDDTWDFQGEVTQQKHRVKIIPSFAVDPLQMRTFLFCLEQDNITGVDVLVALYGVQPIRNAPYYSDFFETTSVGGTYGFNLTVSGISWVIMTENVMDNETAEYDEELAPIYDTIVDKIRYSHLELFSGDNLILPIHIAVLTKQTGSVGIWQQINKDQTVINGNLTTFGADNPMYTDPKEPENEDYWWPKYNMSIVQNFQRTSLPRTHSLSVAFPFVASLAAFGGIIVIIAVSQTTKRKNK